MNLALVLLDALKMIATSTLVAHLSKRLHREWGCRLRTVFPHAKGGSVGLWLDSSLSEVRW